MTTAIPSMGRVAPWLMPTSPESTPSPGTPTSTTMRPGPTE
ncbi:hypothetical protein chiPu_0032857, partial [Chiloscyllium punctatum]|nr:hypothetical protein [Chiloscyllium punctatum]